MKVFISMPFIDISSEKELRERFYEVEKRIEADGHNWLHENLFGYDTCGRDVKNTQAYNLARSIAIMSECDAVYFCGRWSMDCECRIMYRVAYACGMRIFYEANDNTFKELKRPSMHYMFDRFGEEQ